MDPQQTCEVTCPFCFQLFEVAAPPIDTLPATVDYDCEICCRPVLLHFDLDAETVTATAEPN